MWALSGAAVAVARPAAPPPLAAFVSGSLRDVKRRGCRRLELVQAHKRAAGGAAAAVQRGGAVCGEGVQLCEVWWERSGEPGALACMACLYIITPGLCAAVRTQTR